MWNLAGKTKYKIWFEYTQHGTCLSDGWNTDCPFCQESSAKSKFTQTNNILVKRIIGLDC